MQCIISYQNLAIVPFLQVKRPCMKEIQLGGAPTIIFNT